MRDPAQSRNPREEWRHEFLSSGPAESGGAEPTTTELVARILAEEPLGFGAVARRLGAHRSGASVHPGTIARWANDGVRLADGRRLKLEVIRLGGRTVTSWPAVERFIAAQQIAPAPDTGVRTPAERRRASEAAGRELAAAGC